MALSGKALDDLRTAADTLDTLNSSYPETRKFLEARGLTKVSQLDAAGRLELVQHLRAALAAQLERNQAISRFLGARGLTSVDQLDETGRADLADHLKKFSRTC